MSETPSIGCLGPATAFKVRSNEGVRVVDKRWCLLCGSEGTVYYSGLRDRLYGAPGTWNFRKCSNPSCGLVWLDPMPLEDDIGQLYKDYYTHSNGGGKAAKGFLAVAKGAAAWIFRLLARRYGLHDERRELETMYLRDVSPGKLLDVGCGNGSFLGRMRELGWKVQGVEPDPEAARLAAAKLGVPVHVGDLGSAGFPSGYFDAVTLNHVIEHVPDPEWVLQECHRLLRPGGHLVVVTPNVESYGHSVYGLHWRGLEPPRHLWLFSITTLQELVRRAGFSQVDCWTTAANADFFARASLDIGGDGRSPVLQASIVTKAVRFLESRWFQVAALKMHQRHPFSGEELVVKATR